VKTIDYFKTDANKTKVRGANRIWYPGSLYCD